MSSVTKTNLNNDTLSKVVSVGGLTGLVAIVIMLSAFKLKENDLSFTCNRYILNTYLYVFLSFLIIAVLLVTLEHKRVEYLPTLSGFFGLFLLSLAVLIFTMMVDPRNTGTTILKHLLWLGFVLILATLFYPMYRSFTDNKVIISAIVTTLSLVLILSVVAFARPDLISFSWGPVLFTILVTVIIFEIATMLLVPKLRFNPKSKLFKAIAYIVIILFMFYILYDTKMMTVRAKTCNNNADYINESLHLFLDIFNIFVRILSLNR